MKERNFDTLMLPQLCAWNLLVGLSLPITNYR